MATTTRSAKTRQTRDAKKPKSLDNTETESIMLWPKYKDDLPNAFNGTIDLQLDFISKLPQEMLDHIAGFLLLDHEPDRDIRMKENPVPRSHVLLSFAAMSRKMFYSTEAASQKLLKANQDKLTSRCSEPENQDCRRSSRIAAIALGSRPDRVVYRQELLRRFDGRCFACGSRASTAVMANTMCACSGCARIHLNLGGTLTLTQSLKLYDLRDFQLLKSRQPGPRAEPVDHLPAIPYSVQVKGVGFPIFSTVTMYHFREKDVKRIALLVHSDLDKHMKEKRGQQNQRQKKARRERIRKAMLNFHQDRMEVSKGETAGYHAARLEHYQDEDWKTDFGHQSNVYACEDICEECLDVRVRPGLSSTYCGSCHDEYYEKRHNEYLDIFWARLREKSLVAD